MVKCHRPEFIYLVVLLGKLRLVMGENVNTSERLTGSIPSG